MKILSIRQPYAWLIIRGIKPIENRTWTTWYRGPVLIHASRQWARMPLEEIELEFGISIQRDALRRGGVIGMVDLVDVVTASPLHCFEGPYGFVFQRACEVSFVPWNGALGLLNAPSELMSLMGNFDDNRQLANSIPPTR